MIRVGIAENWGKADIKAIFLLFVLLLFLIFILQNMETVDFQFLLWKVSTSRAVILVVSLVIGCFAGMLLGWKLFRKREK